MPFMDTFSEGQEAKRVASRPGPFWPGFAENIVEKAARVETWCSSFNDPGGDYCEWRAFDSEGRPIGTHRVAGY